MTTTAIRARHPYDLLRLARVNAALSAWDEYEANRLLPPDRRRPLARRYQDRLFGLHRSHHVGAPVGRNS